MIAAFFMLFAIFSELESNNSNEQAEWRAAFVWRCIAFIALAASFLALAMEAIL